MIILYSRIFGDYEVNDLEDLLDAMVVLRRSVCASQVQSGRSKTVNVDGPLKWSVARKWTVLSQTGRSFEPKWKVTGQSRRSFDKKWTVLRMNHRVEVGRSGRIYQDYPKVSK